MDGSLSILRYEIRITILDTYCMSRFSILNLFYFKKKKPPQTKFSEVISLFFKYDYIVLKIMLTTYVFFFVQVQQYLSIPRTLCARCANSLCQRNVIQRRWRPHALLSFAAGKISKCTSLTITLELNSVSVVHVHSFLDLFIQTQLEQGATQSLWSYIVVDHCIFSIRFRY